MIIDTKAIDAYRQGVEITQFKHIGIGTFKIHSGEDGHVITLNSYGEERRYTSNGTYADASPLDPVNHLRSADVGAVLDTDIVDDRVLNGSIEPLTIRAVARRERSQNTREPHGVYGTAMGGTEIFYDSTSPVVNIQKFSQNAGVTTFNDCIKYFHGIPMQHETPPPGKMMPYNDVDSVLDSSCPIAVAWRAADAQHKFLDIVRSGYRDVGHVSLDEISAAAGWVYDGTFGTDSITFGGRGH